MNRVPLSELVKFVGGGTPRRDRPDFWNGDIPWVSCKDLNGALRISSSQESITEEGLRSSASNLIPTGSLLVATRMSLGKAVINEVPVAINQDLKAALCSPQLDTRYLLWFWLSQAATLNRLGSGATVKGVTLGQVSNITIPLPPLEEQKRIAAILDKADAIRRKREQAIQLADEFLRSLFLDMFGDPVQNPKGWPVRRLGTAALRFSDGPFGSNLKTEHYVDSGIRVVRLQNIGAGTFRDGDKAFISEQHAETISRHLCQVGDLLIATLGSPNLRACILPETVGSAINKADCLRLKPDPRIANAPYLCWLLNSPQVLVACSDAIHGQTRSRISFGYLRDLEIITPPIQLQNEFAARVEFVREVRSLENRGLELSQEIAKSVNATAFGATSIDRNRSKV